MSQIEIRQKFHAAPERVFQALSDHAGMSAWLAVPVSVPVPTPSGGVGTVRRIHIGPLRVDEEVIEHKPPRRIVYKIVNQVVGVKDHLGEIDVKPNGSGSVVHWRVRIDSPVPGLSTVVTRGLKLGMGRGLAKLARTLRD